MGDSEVPELTSSGDEVRPLHGKGCLIHRPPFAWWLKLLIFREEPKAGKGGLKQRGDEQIRLAEGFGALCPPPATPSLPAEPIPSAHRVELIGFWKFLFYDLCFDRNSVSFPVCTYWECVLRATSMIPHREILLLFKEPAGPSRGTARQGGNPERNQGARMLAVWEVAKETEPWTRMLM